MNNPYVKSINGSEVKRWSIENFKDLSILEQERIKIFYYCLKHTQIQTSFRIPKFVIYEYLNFYKIYKIDFSHYSLLNINNNDK